MYYTTIILYLFNLKFQCTYLHILKITLMIVIIYNNQFQGIIVIVLE